MRNVSLPFLSKDESYKKSAKPWNRVPFPVLSSCMECFWKEITLFTLLIFLEEIRGLSENLDFSLKIPGFFKKRDCLQNLTNVRSSSSIWMCRISNICFDFLKFHLPSENNNKYSKFNTSKSMSYQGQMVRSLHMHNAKECNSRYLIERINVS